ncbi:MAG: SDR family NAD(P)-dependent oxidoreductase, partial [Rhodospirillales bacterium]|nr:SDR family NAD(P)-dependent oxidoreductase [Rhodospirillales bacterium]
MTGLKGQVAIVTGGGGLGKDIALTLAGAGAATVLAGRRAERIEGAQAEITDGGGRALAVQTDVTREENVINLFEKAVEAFDRVDILVNNAGTGSGNRVFVDLSLAEWGEVLATNLTGPFLCSREAM